MSARAEVNARGLKKEPFNVIYDAFAGVATNVIHWGEIDRENAVELRLKQRGPQDWIGICKRIGADGGDEVLFGTGYSFVACLLAVNSAMAANRWRADTPWSPNGSGN